MGTFELLKSRKIDIVLLEETHSTPEAAKIWETSGKGNPFGTPDPVQNPPV